MVFGIFSTGVIWISGIWISTLKVCLILKNEWKFFLPIPNIAFIGLKNRIVEGNEEVENT